MIEELVTRMAWARRNFYRARRWHSVGYYGMRVSLIVTVSAAAAGIAAFVYYALEGLWPRYVALLQVALLATGILLFNAFGALCVRVGPQCEMYLKEWERALAELAKLKAEGRF